MGLIGLIRRWLRGPPPAVVDALPSIVSACSVVNHRLRERGIAHALIGGLALGAHKVIRATEAGDPARREAFSVPPDLPETPEEGLWRAFAIASALEPEIRKNRERLYELGPADGYIL